MADVLSSDQLSSSFDILADLPEDWRTKIAPFWSVEDQSVLTKNLQTAFSSGMPVFPPAKDILNAFKLTPFEKVRVVIVGQDPYHGPNQAHGLCFSVVKGVPKPPSVKNIYTEIENEFQLAEKDIKIPDHGDLSDWARDGVLLLNTALTVYQGAAASHSADFEMKNKRKFGWEAFTDAVLKALNKHHEKLVFMLWGKHAKSKVVSAKIQRDRHYLLESAHPSPFSVHSGFFGNQHFFKCNRYLCVFRREKGIEWVPGLPLEEPPTDDVDTSPLTGQKHSVDDAPKKQTLKPTAKKASSNNGNLLNWFVTKSK